MKAAFDTCKMLINLTELWTRYLSLEPLVESRLGQLKVTSPIFAVNDLGHTPLPRWVESWDVLCWAIRAGETSLQALVPRADDGSWSPPPPYAPLWKTGVEWRGHWGHWAMGMSVGEVMCGYAARVLVWKQLERGI